MTTSWICRVPKTLGKAIRQALLTEKELAASQGVYNFTEKDRYGLDDRARILLTVKDGKYTPAQ